MKNAKNKIIFVAILIFIVFWTFFLYKFSPERIVDSIGIHNSYLVVLFLSFLGGISIVFPFPYYVFVMTFAAGGSNPFLLGIFAGFGLTLGDSTSYLFGFHGGEIIPKKYQKKFKKVLKKVLTYPDYLRTLLIFIWGSIVPLPSDIVTIPMGVLKYPYKKLIVPLGFGHMVFNTIIALSGYYGINFILALF
jgi:membrane protein YqaA with SNARE-associated domain